MESQERNASGVRPWNIAPYSLISWWDMETFSAALFYETGKNLQFLTAKLDLLPADADLSEIANAYAPLFAIIRENCQKIGLSMSVVCVDEMTTAIGVPGITVGRYRDHLIDLGNTIRREMQVEAFFHMPPRQVDFYGHAALFGDLVNSQFPSMQFDITEAGNCYAMGRGTACVFHLMRVMEIGVQEFGKRLKVPLVESKRWHNILDEANKAIRALPQKEASTKAMSEAVANLYAVKLAWRNEVMHPNDTYTLEEAENLLRLVKLFISQLATII